MDETTKEEVRERAAGHCEYCRLPAAHVVTPFQIEHIRRQAAPGQRYPQQPRLGLPPL